MWWTKLTPTWNTYRGTIAYLRRWNWGRDSKTMSGLPDNNKLILKIGLAKLKAHNDASDILCACSLIASRNGRQEVSGACCETRCRSCWPRHIYWTQRWFPGLESFQVLKALHIVNDQGQRIPDYISTDHSVYLAKGPKTLTRLLVTIRRDRSYTLRDPTSSYNTGKWVELK